MLKRLFDILCSLTGLICLLPLFLVLAIVIKWEDGGPVFYRGRRVGRYGKPFRLYKFRSMMVNADQTGTTSAGDDDPRITRTGRFLRKCKLDELPQLLNVLKGEMSLVGPRPQVQWAVDLYTPDERQILDVQPGITDNASLQFCNEGEILRGSTDADKDYMKTIHAEKMRLGLEYVRTRTFRGDIKIIFRTIAKLLRH